MTMNLRPRLRLATALLLAASASPLALADSLPISQPVTVTLDSGVKILLKPDHSWEYQLDEVQAASAPATQPSVKAGSALVPTSTAVPVTAAVAPAGDSASPSVSAASASASNAAPDSASRLNSSALANPRLLSEGHRDGLVARLSSVSEEDDEALLQFSLDNTAGQSVIGVQARLRLYADDGHLLATREVPLWVGEYRLPQTYLRPGQTRDSREVRVSLPEGEWSRQLVRVEVTEVEFR
ncbi:MULTISPECIES: DUF3157 family protein [unclassified Cobetia]|uniref:DUF3157 family protein n=1 Tax=unclassified Cobetia TaxID=2609414 RepID=UPI00178CC3FC|nr:MULTISPECIES: DUF3157 family protein [unclassified Cobetia]MBE2169460.1 DUF3157 family protein [Cobetia sp. 2AS1]MDH2448267.1 DUF3157 family protein [Cobetia sp. 2AS]